MLRRLLILLLLIAACLCAPAAAETEKADAGMLRVHPGGITVFVYSPAADGEYGIYFFSEEDASAVSARVYRGETLLREGSGVPGMLRVLMAKDQSYTIVINSGVEGLVEVAPMAHSRCPDNPIYLENDEIYRKSIARVGNSHWYRFEPTEAGNALLLFETEKLSGLDVRAFDEKGRMLKRAKRIDEKALLMDLSYQRDAIFLLRVTDTAEKTGSYSVKLATSAVTQVPSAFTLPYTTVTLNGYDSRIPRPNVEPREACALYYLRSENEDIVRIPADTTILGVGVGSAKVTAYGCGGLRAEFMVEVRNVPTEGIETENETLSLRVGDETQLQARVKPDNALERKLIYESSDPEKLAVDERGTLTALAEGTASLTVSTPDRAFKKTVSVQVDVALPKYRALLIAEENYASTVRINQSGEIASDRGGAVDSVRDLAHVLSKMSYRGEQYRRHLLYDQSRDKIIAQIREDFGQAKDDDVSLFYINCHGFEAMGTTQLLMVDGSVISAYELSEELSRIRGTVIVLIDCCTSGGAIGEATLTPNVNSDVTSLYRGVVSPSVFRDSRFYVLTSARLEQESYRTGASEGSLRTVFVRALTEAAEQVDGRFVADTDGDGSVSFTELLRSMRKSSASQTEAAGVSGQTLCASPQVGSLTVFANSKEP